MDQSSGTGEPDYFIPVRKIDILDAVVADSAFGSDAERQKFRQLCRLLGAILHHRFFDRLERLRNDYFYFSPDVDHQRGVDPATIEGANRELMDTLAGVLNNANFIEIPPEEINQAHREHALVQVDLHAPIDNYRDVRFFRRGHHRETIEIKEWFGWRTRTMEVDVYDNVVLIITISNDAQPRKRHTRHIKLRPGAVLLKYFRDIARTDLNALFPDVRVVMGLKDRLWLGIPAIFGGIPILIKLATTVTVLFVVAGFYLGMAGSVKDADIAGALAAVGGLVALGGFVMRQWTKFQRQSLLYQKILSENVYFRNVNNNAGIFDYIIGEAEEQQLKKAFLTYKFLHFPGDGPTEQELNLRIEQWLQARFGISVDFECRDVIERLDQLGLLRRDGPRLLVASTDETLNKLRGLWAGFGSEEVSA
jgi:Protein of unknown function (DUF3754)